jgi:hypothetical protein
MRPEVNDTAAIDAFARKAQWCKPLLDEREAPAVVRCDRSPRNQQFRERQRLRGNLRICEGISVQRACSCGVAL